jgi:catechol 2,3-dioxygenase-like lactoylglutathione lyase family enzyme
VVTDGWITQGDRERWQREAVRELAAILDAHPGLPLIAWTVGPAGGSLAGRAGGPRAAFAVWQQALGLDDVLEVPAGDGSAIWLRARARRGGIQVTVTATVTAGETGTAP